MRCGAAARGSAQRRSSPAPRSSSRRSPGSRPSGTSWRSRCLRSRAAAAPRASRALRRFADARAGRVASAQKKLVLDRRRRDDARRRSSARSRAAARRRSRSSPSTATTGRATSVFPSLTPVCLIVDRDRRRPGRAPHPARSSGGTARSAGSSSTARRSRRCARPGWRSRSLDTIFNMNAAPPRAGRGHGLRGARGRRARRRRGEHHVLPRPHRHLPTLPWVTKPRVRAEALLLLQPLRVGPDGRAVRRAQPRAPARSTRTPPAVGRWLVTRDGFDFLAYYLSDFDFASHAHGPHGGPRTSRSSSADAAIRRAARRGRRAGRVPRALRRGPPLRPRPDAGRARGAPRGAVRAISTGRSSSRPRTAPGRSTCCPDARVDAAELARRARRRRRRSRRHAPARGRRGRRRAREELRFRPSATAGRSGDRILDQPRCASQLVGAREPERRRAARLGGARAGSSPTSAAATTRAAAATARSSRATRSCRSLTVGVDATLAAHHRRRARRARALRRRSARVDGGARPCRLTSRRDGRAPAARARHRRRARARGDGTRAARALRPAGAAATRPTPTPRCRSAASRRSRSRTWSRSSARSSRCSGGEKVLDVGTGSGYQAAVLAELAGEVHTIERIPELAEAARANARGGGLRGPRPRPRRRRHARPARARAVRRDRRRRGRARGRRPRSTSSSSRAAGSSSRSAAADEQLLEVVVRTPEGPAVLRTVPCRFVPLVGRSDVCAASARLDTMGSWGRLPLRRSAASRAPARDPARPADRPPARPTSWQRASASSCAAATRRRASSRRRGASRGEDGDRRASALMLLEDVAFYRSAASSFRSLRR